MRRREEACGATSGEQPRNERQRRFRSGRFRRAVEEAVSASECCAPGHAAWSRCASASASAEQVRGIAAASEQGGCSGATAFVQQRPTTSTAVGRRSSDSSISIARVGSAAPSAIGPGRTGPTPHPFGRGQAAHGKRGRRDAAAVRGATCTAFSLARRGATAAGTLFRSGTSAATHSVGGRGTPATGSFEVGVATPGPEAVGRSSATTRVGGCARASPCPGRHGLGRRGRKDDCFRPLGRGLRASAAAQHGAPSRAEARGWRPDADTFGPTTAPLTVDGRGTAAFDASP